MRCIAVATLSLGLLLGCSGAPVTTAVQAANQPPAPLHSVNRYELHGSPDKVALLVDSETGDVWRYQKSGSKDEFVPVEVPQKVETWDRDATGKLVCTANCSTKPKVQ